MKITGLSHLFKWENLHNWWLTKYFFAPLYICIYRKKNYVLSNCLSVLILYFNAAKFSIKLFYFIFFTVFFVSQRDKYDKMTETQPLKNT